MLNQEQLTLSGISQQKKGISGESMGEIQIYYGISALILQSLWKSLKGKWLNNLGSNLTHFYPLL